MPKKTSNQDNYFNVIFFKNHKFPYFAITKSKLTGTITSFKALVSPTSPTVSFLSVIRVLNNRVLCCFLYFLRNEIVNVVSIYQVLYFYQNETSPMLGEVTFPVTAVHCVCICFVICIRKASVCINHSSVIKIKHTE